MTVQPLLGGTEAPRQVWAGRLQSHLAAQEQADGPALSGGSSDIFPHSPWQTQMCKILKPQSTELEMNFTSQAVKISRAS